VSIFIKTRTISTFITRYLLSLVIVLGGALLALGAWIYTSTPGQNKLEWELFKQPEALTELFFTSHTSLPRTYLPGETYTVSFTITNKEGHTVTYPYELIQEGGQGKTLLKAGAVTLEDTHSHTEAVPVTYIDSGAEARITVSLPDQNQSLQYFVKKGPS
jgi:hypothetical protein